MNNQICNICYHKIEYYQGDSEPFCSEFCSSTSKKEKEAWKKLKKDEWGLFPCANCGCTIDDVFYGHDERICSSCGPEVNAKKFKDLLSIAVDYIDKPELINEIKAALGQKGKTSSRKERFGLMSTIHSDLILAEERYLETCGWKRVSPKKKEILSLWKTPEFSITYSRNHAVQVCKARDENLGYW